MHPQVLRQGQWPVSLEEVPRHCYSHGEIIHSCLNIGAKEQCSSLNQSRLSDTDYMYVLGFILHPFLSPHHPHILHHLYSVNTQMPFSTQRQTTHPDTVFGYSSSLACNCIRTDSAGIIWIRYSDQEQIIQAVCPCVPHFLRARLCWAVCPQTALCKLCKDSQI